MVGSVLAAGWCVLWCVCGDGLDVDDGCWGNDYVLYGWYGGTGLHLATLHTASLCRVPAPLGATCAALAGALATVDALHFASVW